MGVAISIFYIYYNIYKINKLYIESFEDAIEQMSKCQSVKVSKRASTFSVQDTRLNGSETIVIGAQQYTSSGGQGKANVFANAIRHDFRSPNPTTRWRDIIKLK